MQAMSERDDRRARLLRYMPGDNFSYHISDIETELDASQREREELATYRELSKLVESYADEACELKALLSRSDAGSDKWWLDVEEKIGPVSELGICGKCGGSGNEPDEADRGMLCDECGGTGLVKV